MIELYEIRRKLKELVLPQLQRAEKFISGKELPNIRNSKMVASFVKEDNIVEDGSSTPGKEKGKRKYSPN